MITNTSLAMSTKIPGSRSRQLPVLAPPNNAALAPDSTTSITRKPNTVAAIFAEVACVPDSLSCS